MNKIANLLVALIVLSGAVSAQDDSEKQLGWTTGATLSLNTSQMSLTNWVAGGQNSISLNSLFNANFNHLGQKHSWDNTLDIGYGLIKQGNKDFFKSDDKIELNSKFGVPLSEKTSATALVNFKSQMTAGYPSPEDATLISDVLSPAYVLLATGVDAKWIDGLSVFLAPISGKITIVNNPELSASGSFGVEPGESLRSELGAYFRATYTGDIMKNVSLTNKVDLFSNYLNNPQYIDVNWEVLLMLKVNKFITASINTHLIYDKDIDIGVDTSGDGTLDDFGPRVQFKEIIGLGLSYTF